MTTRRSPVVVILHRMGKPDSAAIYLVDHPGAAQSVIRALHTTIPRQHPDYFGLLLLNSAFGGQFTARLNRNLRQEKGYSYGYHSLIQWHQGPSLLAAGGSVQTAVTQESVGRNPFGSSTTFMGVGPLPRKNWT